MQPGELTQDEFFDVYRKFRPHATRKEFEREWDKFQQAKAEHLQKREVQ